MEWKEVRTESVSPSDGGRDDLLELGNRLLLQAAELSLPEPQVEFLQQLIDRHCSVSVVGSEGEGEKSAEVSEPLHKASEVEVEEEKAAGSVEKSLEKGEAMEVEVVEWSRLEDQVSDEDFSDEYSQRQLHDGEDELGTPITSRVPSRECRLFSLVSYFLKQPLAGKAPRV